MVNELTPPVDIDERGFTPFEVGLVQPDIFQPRILFDSFILIEVFFTCIAKVKRPTGCSESYLISLFWRIGPRPPGAIKSSTAFFEVENSSSDSKGSRDFKYFDAVSLSLGMGSLGIFFWLSNVLRGVVD